MLKKDNSNLQAVIERYSIKVEELFKKLHESELVNVMNCYKIEKLQWQIDIANFKLSKQVCNQAINSEVESKLSDFEKKIVSIEEKNYKELYEKSKEIIDQNFELTVEINAMKTIFMLLEEEKKAEEIRIKSLIFDLAPMNKDKVDKKEIENELESMISKLKSSEDFQKIKENLPVKTPPTNPERSFPEIDFNIDPDDEEAFKKIQEILQLRDKEYEEKKKKKEK